MFLSLVHSGQYDWSAISIVYICKWQRRYVCVDSFCKQKINLFHLEVPCNCLAARLPLQCGAPDNMIGSCWQCMHYYVRTCEWYFGHIGTKGKPHTKSFTSNQLLNPITCKSFAKVTSNYRSSITLSLDLLLFLLHLPLSHYGSFGNVIKSEICKEISLIDEMRIRVTRLTLRLRKCSPQFPFWWDKDNYSIQLFSRIVLCPLLISASPFFFKRTLDI